MKYVKSGRSTNFVFSELRKVVQSRALQFPRYCQKLAKICLENVFYVLLFIFCGRVGDQYIRLEDLVCIRERVNI